MKALIFGCNGQDGHYLKIILKKNGVTTIGISRKCGDVIGDINNFHFVSDIIKVHRPDYIFHFAAKSTTRHEALFENHATISTGTLNILESVKLYSPGSKIFLAGSAMQFKNEGIPIDEQTVFEAKSAYSVARIQSVYAARYFKAAFNLNVYVGYFFNHDSPLRSEDHVNQKIVRAVQRIAEGSKETIELGDINVIKEFNYAGDAMEAIWLLINQNNIYEAIIGNGEPHSIKEWVEYCFSKINKRWQDFVTIKSVFTPEYKMLVSNPELIKSLGWQPQVDFNTLADLMMKNK